MFTAIFFSSILCLTVLISTCAGVSREVYFKDPAHPGKCKVGNNILSPGQGMKHPLLICAHFTCSNAQGLAIIETCDALPSPLTKIKNYDPKNPPTCKWGELIDTSALYPACCKRNFSCVF